MEKVLTSETKCRRCGHISEWYFSNEYTRKKWETLANYCFAHFNSPSICHCKICKKDTIQDYVAYTNNNKDLL